MAQCAHCNKNGILVTVNKYGLCKKCENSINGKIKYYDLIPFWLSLSPYERQKCEEANSMGIWTGGNSGLLTGDISFTSQSKSAFLSVLGSNLISQKEYALIEKLLNLSEQAADGLVDLHFCYNHWIELTYKQRENSDYLNRCIEYCRKDIDLYPQIDKEMSILSKDGKITKARIPSFERLSIIHEKQGNIKEAINICELAIRYSLKDSTKGGFEGRLEKLRKKISKV